jgi:hypothetical protein
VGEEFGTAVGHGGLLKKWAKDCITRQFAGLAAPIQAMRVSIKIIVAYINSINRMKQKDGETHANRGADRDGACA